MNGEKLRLYFKLCIKSFRDSLIENLEAVLKQENIGFENSFMWVHRNLVP